MAWGWNPDTVMTLATVAAAIAAIVAGVFAALAYRKERNALRAQLARMQRRQAEAIAAWEGDDPPSIVVQNGSQSPAYNVRLWVHVGQLDPIYAGWFRVLPPTAGTALPLHPEAQDQWAEWLAKPLARAPQSLVEFTFRDADGEWWWRPKQGHLEPISEREAWRYGDRPEAGE